MPSPHAEKWMGPQDLILPSDQTILARIGCRSVQSKCNTGACVSSESCGLRRQDEIGLYSQLSKTIKVECKKIRSLMDTTNRIDKTKGQMPDWFPSLLRNILSTLIPTFVGSTGPQLFASIIRLCLRQLAS